MANKDVFTATRVDQPRDFYINGESQTAQAGSYLLHDADGNLEIISSTDFEQGYADAGTGVSGEVTKVKPNKRADKANAAESELAVAAPSTPAVTTDSTGQVTPVAEKPTKGSAAPASASAGVPSSETTGATPPQKVGPAATGDKPPTDNSSDNNGKN